METKTLTQDGGSLSTPVFGSGETRNKTKEMNDDTIYVVTIVKTISGFILEVQTVSMSIRMDRSFTFNVFELQCCLMKSNQQYSAQRASTPTNKILKVSIFYVKRDSGLTQMKLRSATPPLGYCLRILFHNDWCFIDSANSLEKPSLFIVTLWINSVCPIVCMRTRRWTTHWAYCPPPCASTKHLEALAGHKKKQISNPFDSIAS